MSKLNIYIASAGAGKTHNLTREYLRLSLQKDFRRVQAVTFTNKATEEMKARIITELYTMATERLDGEQRLSPFFDELAAELGYTAIELRDRAREILRSMLLDYGNFRVKTIDSFFQEILRSFARELNLSGSFRLNLDAKEALDAAVVGVLAEQDSLDNADEVQRWLISLAREMIQKGKGHDLRATIRRLAKELEHEEVKKLRVEKRLPDKVAIRNLKRALYSRRKALDLVLTTMADQVFDELRSLGIADEELSNGESGGLSPFFKIRNNKHNIEGLISSNQFVAKPKRFIEALDKDLAPLIAKSKKELADKRASVLQSTRLRDLMKQYDQDTPRVLSLLYTIYSMEELLSSYGLIAEVDTKLKEQQKRENSMLLMDAPSLIHQILSDPSGVPFIYERIGTRIEHQMIDEFQDTSQMQYENFLPLLVDSLASGNDNLVVGDVKQSIYRFRNSDSSLLGSRIFNDFCERYDKITLSENWRSSPAIVEFNNQLFATLAQFLGNHYHDYISQLEEEYAYSDCSRVRAQADRFELYYEDVRQSIPETRQSLEGLVVVHDYSLITNEELEIDATEGTEGTNGADVYTPPSTDDSDTYPPPPDGATLGEQLPLVIIDLQKRGYRPADIAILVRNRREATIVANYLAQWATRDDFDRDRYSLDLISAEALQVSNALSIRFVIAALGYIMRPDAGEARLLLNETYRQFADSDTPQTDMTEEQYKRILEIGRTGIYETIEGILSEYKSLLSPGELPHQIKLLDIALAFQQDLSADISDFLAMWAEKGDEYRLVVPEDERKIRLMTIHKSKGLGFDVVLLPCPNWDINETNYQKAPILWCKTPTELDLGEGMPSIVPVRFRSSLTKSLFSSDYITESINMALDALNLLYVATTRAKRELHIWMPDEETSDPKKLNRLWGKNKDAPHKTIAGILELALRDSSTYQRHCLGDDLEALHTPLAKPNSSQSKHIDTIAIRHISANPIGNRLQIRREASEHFAANNPRLYGSLMHFILAEIETPEDIVAALHKAKTLGLAQEADIKQYHSDLRDWLEKLEYKRWFDGSAHILRELPIIGGTLTSSRRPDRVMIFEDGSAEIVDYKFGKEHKRYERQVLQYMDLIQQMGYSPVRGYVWYVLTGKVLTITQDSNV